MARGRKPNSAKTTTVESIAKMQLDAQENFLKLVDGIALVSSTFDKIKAEADLAKEELGYNLKAKQVEINDQILALETDFNVLKEKNETETETENAEIEKFKAECSKTLETLKYENALSIRDANLEAATKIATEYELSLVDTTEYLKLKNTEDVFTTESEKFLKESIGKAVSKATSLLKSEHLSINNENSLTIKLLEKELELIKESLTSTKETIKDQNNLIKEHPKQIQEALSSARVDLKQNFGNTK